MIGMRSVGLIPFAILKELFTNFPALYFSAEKADWLRPKDPTGKGLILMSS